MENLREYNVVMKDKYNRPLYMSIGKKKITWSRKRENSLSWETPEEALEWANNYFVNFHNWQVMEYELVPTYKARLVGVVPKNYINGYSSRGRKRNQLSNCPHNQERLREERNGDLLSNVFLE